MGMYQMSCTDFANALASEEAVPGGGGAAAMAGAFGVALGSMVANLTVGKEKYADVQDEIIALKNKAEDLLAAFLLLVQEDAENCEPLALAYRLPVDTDEERFQKLMMMEEALVKASETPIDIMKMCGEAIALHEELAKKGSALAKCDVGVGVELCLAALRGAAFNVFINTKLMRDRDHAEDLNAQAEKMLDEYGKKAEEVSKLVRESLK